MKEKGVKITSWVDGLELSVAIATYQNNTPMGKLVEDVRHSIASYLLQQPIANGRDMRIEFDFEDGMFLIYGVKYGKGKRDQDLV